MCVVLATLPSLPVFDHFILLRPLVSIVPTFPYLTYFILLPIVFYPPHPTLSALLMSRSDLQRLFWHPLQVIVYILISFDRNIRILSALHFLICLVLIVDFFRNAFSQPFRSLFKPQAHTPAASLRPGAGGLQPTGQTIPTAQSLISADFPHDIQHLSPFQHIRLVCATHIYIYIQKRIIYETVLYIYIYICIYIYQYL